MPGLEGSTDSRLLGLHLSALLTTSLLLAGCDEEGISAKEYAVLAERIAVLEAEGTGNGGGGAVAEQIAALEDDLAAVQADMGAVTDEVASLQDAVDASVGDVVDRGGVWFEEGTGAGTCARVDVVTNLDRPLVVFATLEATADGNASMCAGAPSGSCGVASDSSSWESMMTASVVTKEVGGGGWSQTFSRTEGLSDYTTLSVANYTQVTSTSSGSWTMPISQVLEIPSSGSYTVEIQVTGTATPSTCRLIVVQP